MPRSDASLAARLTAGVARARPAAGESCGACGCARWTASRAVACVPAAGRGESRTTGHGMSPRWGEGSVVRTPVTAAPPTVVRDQQLCRVLITKSAELPGGERRLTTAGPPLRGVGSW